MATVTTNLAASSLRDCCDLRVMNNGKVTAANRSLWAGVGAQLRMLGQVIAAIRRTRAQIVHIHTCALFSFWRDQLHMLWARLLGAKVVWHLHDGTFLQFVSKGGRLKRGLIRLGLRMGSAAIVLSEESRRNLRAHVPKANWQVVTNGVQLPEIARRDVAGLTKFLFLGNLTRRKGAFDLADAAEAATAQGANLQVILAGGEVVAGQRQELVNHIMQLRCHERIVLCGLLAGLDKERALAEADCLVLPSYAEGLPMAVLEGMSYGLPVIASRVGAIPEAVEDGSEGFLLDSGDVEGLSRCMLRLCAEPELRRQMGERARLRAEKYFNLDVVVGKIMTIYHDILATQAKRENCG
jgi:glycosyltransferase involved in cell wall biosynthesis